MIQIALNGNRSAAQVPKSTAEIVQAAVSAVQAGAESIHFHVRGDKGRETLAAAWVEEQVSKLKQSLGSIPIGISTGAWIEPDLDARLALIESWRVLPDFVSINFDEMGYEQVARLVASKGIEVEAGLSKLASAQNFVNSSLDVKFLRILIEPQENTTESAVRTVQAIEALLKDCGNRLPVLLHGVDNTCWELLRLAFEKGYATRIGFEDTLLLPDGQPANSNAELLKEAKKLKTEMQIN
ncbi:hypothetical protein D770_09145 [Flammeovirgaceae bacterium 311]|nr:hypothetical protein D770_09145 [Flammeovirgaceae bacterium 311]